MKKLNPISPEKLIKILKRQGFNEIRQKGFHKFFRNAEGRTTVEFIIIYFIWFKLVKIDLDLKITS